MLDTAYLRCSGCSNIMPIDGVQWDGAELERCHMCGAEYIIEREDDMPAEHNPYRQALEGRAAAGEMGSVGLAEYVPADTGPGLLAADIDHIARSHYRAGRLAAEEEAKHREVAMLGQLAQAYDDGHDAGMAGRWRDLAHEFRRRLIADLHFPLQVIENGPKTRAFEKLPTVREALDGLVTFAEGIEEAGRTPRQPPGEPRP